MISPKIEALTIWGNAIMLVFIILVTLVALGQEMVPTIGLATMLTFEW